MIFILGGSGFVGSSFVKIFEDRKIDYRIINKENYNEYKGAGCSLFINANGNAKKFLAVSSPQKDFSLTVRSVYESLFDFRYEKYIYLSSSEIYGENFTNADSFESSEINFQFLSNYGFNKYLSELIVQKFAKSWLIFRLSGMVGAKLKKNLIWDLINDLPIRLHPKSRLQFIETTDVASIVMQLVDSKVSKEIYNVGGREALYVDEIIKLSQKKPIFHESAILQIQEMSIHKIAKQIFVPSTDESLSKFFERNI